MAQLIVKNITGKKDWYPCFSTTIRLGEEEKNKMPAEMTERAKKLKNGTYKIFNSFQCVGSNPTQEDIYSRSKKMLNYFGIEIE